MHLTSGQAFLLTMMCSVASNVPGLEPHLRAEDRPRPRSGIWPAPVRWLAIRGSRRLPLAGLLGLLTFLLVVAPAGCNESNTDTAQAATHRASKTRVGTARPDFSHVDAGNVLATLKAFRGRVVLLNFWATWCPPCRHEMPILAAFARSHPKVVLVTVSMDGLRNAARARAFLDRNGVKAPRFPRYVYSGGRMGIPDVARTLGVPWRGGLPVTFLYDAKGVLQDQHLGPFNRYMLNRFVTPHLK